MKELVIKTLFYIWFLFTFSVILFIPFYTLGTFVAIVGLMVGKNYTVLTIAKVCFFISSVISLFVMCTGGDAIEKCYEETRNKKK